MWLLYGLLIGLTAGILSGLMGIGGGVIMIPALVLIMGFDQHLSQGTTLAAMVPPIGILAAYEYYKGGHVNIPVALLLALGFVVGGMIGGRIAVGLDHHMLKRIFGILMLLISLHIIFSK